jgi:UDP-N-acetyl-D-glucosamine dehydrogenase
MKKSVAIVGLGYVGLPLAVACAKSGFKTFGIDYDASRIEKLLRGESYIEDVTTHSLTEIISSEKFIPSADYSTIKSAQIIVICVPTPLTQTKLPDLSFLQNAVENISLYLEPGSLVILESTVAPRTSRNEIIPLIEKYSKYSIDHYFYAFSPERTDPKNTKWNLNNTPKLVAGLNQESLKKATSFYSEFINTIVECSSLEIAETAKLLENSFRLVNISFINEVSIFCQETGIDIEEVVRAASSKPYGFMPFFPSIGAGGHCIPVDPIYLSEYAKSQGAPTNLIDLAVQINQEMPSYYVKKVQNILGTLEGKRILVIGVSYKSGVSDVRESPVVSLIMGLREQKASVDWHDDQVKVWKGEISAKLSHNYDLAIVAIRHKSVDLTQLGDVQIIRI